MDLIAGLNEIRNRRHDEMLKRHRMRYANSTRINWSAEIRSAIRSSEVVEVMLQPGRPSMDGLVACYTAARRMGLKGKLRFRAPRAIHGVQFIVIIPEPPKRAEKGA